MKRIVFLLAGFFCVTSMHAQTLAFPGAEGFGAYATGGRGGTVYHVTNLNNDGPGSFRDAVSDSGRIIVFDIGGVIHIKGKLKAAPRLTLAGQTAPGEGIVVYGDAVSFSGNTIVRYMRFRGSVEMSRGSCTVVADDLEHIIFDHVSIEWGRWDNLHVKNSRNVTFQYCIIGEAIQPQRFGALMEGPVDVTVHHCLWIDNQSRNPKGKAGIAYINNVVYNWGSNGFVGGHSAADHYQDLLANYFIAGPNSSDHFIGMFSATDHVYQQGNFTDMDKDGTLNGRPVTKEDFVNATATLLPQPSHPSPVPVTLQTASAAYQATLEKAGATLFPDVIDARLKGYLASLGKEGKIVMTEAEAGGQPDLPTGKMQKDKDGDGMPDAWEKKHHLNKRTADAGGYDLSKEYTNIEMYINGLAP